MANVEPVKSKSTVIDRRACCDFCGKWFAGTRFRWKHIRNNCAIAREKREAKAGKKEEFPCPKCEMQLANQLTLKVHLTRCKGGNELKSKLLPCHHCGKVYVSVKALATHVERLCKIAREKRGDDSGKKEERACCDFCGKWFGGTRARDRHINHACAIAREKREEKDGKKEEFPCPKCGMQLANQLTLKRHLTKCKDNKEPKSKRVPCNHCGKFYVSAKVLGTHVEHSCKIAREKREDDAKKKEEFPCPKCGKHLANKLSLNEHMKYIHKEKPRTTPRIPCEFCGKLYANEKNRNRHVVYNCDIARDKKEKESGEKEGQQKEENVSKMQTKEAEKVEGKGRTSSSTCEECGRTFAQQLTLAQHVIHNCKKAKERTEAANGNIEEFPCHLCKRNFLSKQAVYLHSTYFCKRRIRVETKAVRKHSCPRCSRKFKTKWRFDNHKMTCHLFFRAPFQLNYPCCKCSAVNEDVLEMRTHLKTHGIVTLDHLGVRNVTPPSLEESPNRAWYICAICADLKGDLEGSRMHIERCLRFQQSAGVPDGIESFQADHRYEVINGAVYAVNKYMLNPKNSHISDEKDDDSAEADLDDVYVPKANDFSCGSDEEDDSMLGTNNVFSLDEVNDALQRH